MAVTVKFDFKIKDKCFVLDENKVKEGEITHAVVNLSSDGALTKYSIHLDYPNQLKKDSKDVFKTKKALLESL